MLGYALLSLLLALIAPVLPACPSEGQEGMVCVWDASQRGNGEGQSFVGLPDGTPIYISTGE